MSKRIRLNMHDQFSGCTDSREMNVTDEQLVKIEKHQSHGVPVPEFANNIRYEWVIDEVELLN